MPNLVKKCAKIISYLLVFCLVAGVLLYFGRNILFLLKNVDLLWIGIAILLQIPMIAFGGLAFKILSLPFNINMRWQDWSGLSFIANFVNQLLPYRPGMVFRYLYMRQHYHMKTVVFVHVMFIYLLLTLLVSCLFVIFGWITATTTSNLTLLLCALAIILVMVGILLLLKLTIAKVHARISKTSLIAKLSDALNTLFNNPAILLGSAFSLLIVNGLTALIFYFVFLSLNTPIALTDCFFIVGVVVLSMIIPMTPGNIGILETIVGTLTQMLYQDFSLGFSATALFRASQWVPSALLGTGFSLMLIGSAMPHLKQLKLGVGQRVD